MKSILILTIAVILLSCSSNDNQVESNGVNIRLSNISEFDFKNIKVNPFDRLVSFDKLIQNHKTKYEVFEKAYRYAFIQLEIEGVIFTLQPIDYVGETPLEYGNYTYEINFNPQNQDSQISLALLKN